MRSSMLVFLALAWYSVTNCLASETVRFPSAAAPPSAFAISRAQATGVTPVPAQPEEITGELYKPDGSGPFPAIVVMHGCGSRSPNPERDFAARFVAWGYVVLAVDSFSTRGIENTCGTGLPSSTMDAFGALNFILTESFVDGNHVGILGFSQGGATALDAAGRYKTFFSVHTFAASIAYYPGSCDITNGEMIPTLILIGELDDWSPVSQCRNAVATHNGSNGTLKLIAYPGAYHDFIWPRTAATGVNYFGHHLEYSRAAAERSFADLHDFIRLYLTR